MRALAIASLATVVLVGCGTAAADTAGLGAPSDEELRVSEETLPIESAEELAAVHLDAARNAGASVLEPSSINRIATDACLAVLAGGSDIDTLFERGVEQHANASGAPRGEVATDVAASLAVAGIYCPQLWDEFQAWEPPVETAPARVLLA